MIELAVVAIDQRFAKVVNCGALRRSICNFTRPLLFSWSNDNALVAHMARNVRTVNGTGLVGYCHSQLARTNSVDFVRPLSLQPSYASPSRLEEAISATSVSFGHGATSFSQIFQYKLETSRNFCLFFPSIECFDVLELEACFNDLNVVGFRVVYDHDRTILTLKIIAQWAFQNGNLTSQSSQETATLTIRIIDADVDMLDQTVLELGIVSAM